MDKLLLTVEERTTTGKRVKNLRKEGLVPANIFGKTQKSTSIQLPLKDFQTIFKKAGETTLVYIKITGEKEERPTLIKNIQVSPIDSRIIHVDFHQVSLKEKVTAHIPVVSIGEAKAVTDKIGSLLSLIGEVEVEALPTDLPENFEVDVTSLSAVEQSIKVKDLKFDTTKVTILTDIEQDLFRVEPLVSKEAEELAKEEAEKAIAANGEADSAGEVSTPSTDTAAPTETPKTE